MVVGPVRWLGRSALALSLSMLVACASTTPPQVFPSEPAFDRAVPEAVARAEARYTVDLPPVADCEMAFDLQLYRDRRVELVRWDDKDGCNHRNIEVRYLSQLLPEQELFDLVGKFARVARRPQQ